MSDESKDIFQSSISELNARIWSGGILLGPPPLRVYGTMEVDVQTN
jgi:hypothetical protein